MSARLRVAAVVAALAVAAMACSQNAGEPPERRATDEEPEAAEPEAQVPEGPTGVIEGRIALEGDPPERVPLRRGSDPVCDQTEMLSETVVTGSEGRLQDVFVRVRGDDLRGPTPSEPVVIDQKECMYRPRVQGGVAGQTLRVKNSDDTLHNVHARETTLERKSARTLYNLAQPPGSGDLEQAIEASDVMELRCDLHSWMRAFVIVSDHPYFATSGEDGRFRIENVPTGSYDLETWHELYGSQTVAVTVEEGETAEVELSYGAEAHKPD